MRRALIALAALFCIVLAGYTLITKTDLSPTHQRGDVIATIDGVSVYYNGGVGQVSGRNLGDDGYNIGLKWQCVEFVKRYYYEHFQHIMPDSYGHARDFYDNQIGDGEINPARNLIQYKNGGTSAPQHGDILVFGPSLFNRYGHVAIVASVSENELIYIGQNQGPFSKPEKTLAREGNHVKNSRLRGWLRLERRNQSPAN